MKKILYLISIFFIFASITYATSYTRLGPGGGGYIDAILVDPDHPEIVYVATDNAGIFKTTDSGATWTSINSGLTSYRVSSLAFGSSTSVIWAGTMTGPFKSTDGGATWTAKRTGFPTLSQAAGAREASSLGFIYVDPTDSDNMLAGCGKTLYMRYNSNCSEFGWKSVDGGENWTALTKSGTYPDGNYDINVTAGAIDFSDKDRLYIGVSSSTAAQNALYTSDDGGDTWSKLTVTGTLDKITQIQCTGVTGEVYVSTANNGDSTDGLFLSTNSGATFSAELNPAERAHEYSRTFRVLDFTGPKIVAGFEGRIYSSTNGGSTWPNDYDQPSPIGFIDEVSAVYTVDAPADFSVIYHGYNSPRKYTAAGGWEQLYTTITSGTPDRYSNIGFLNNVVENIWVSSNRQVMIMPSWDYSAFYSTDGGNTWYDLAPTIQGITTGEKNCFAAAYDGTYYYMMCGQGLTGTDSKIYKSGSGDLSSWSMNHNTGVTGNVSLAVFTSGATTRIFLGESGNVYKYSDNAGVDWSAAVDPQSTKVMTFAQDPQNPNTIYIGTLFLNGGIFKSTDFGATLVGSPPTNIAHSNMQAIYSIAVNPVDSNTIAVATSDYSDGNNGGIWLTTDGAASGDSSWTRIDTNISLPNEDAGSAAKRWGCAVKWNSTGTRLYVGFRAQELDSSDQKGMFYTDDLGTSWTEIDLPIKMVRGLYIADDVPYAALDGGGAVQINYDSYWVDPDGSKESKSPYPTGCQSDTQLTGSDACTIDYAFDNAAAGETWNFNGGTYAYSGVAPAAYHGVWEPANAGTSDDQIIFQASSGETPVLRAAWTDDTICSFIIATNKDYITLDGFSTSALGDDSAGVHIGGSPGDIKTGVVVKNFTSIAGSNNFSTGDNMDLWRVDDITNSTISNNRIGGINTATYSDNNGAIKIYHAVNLTIENNEIFDSPNGIVAKGYINTSTIRYNFIRGCTQGIRFAHYGAINSNTNAIYHNIVSLSTNLALNVYSEGDATDDLSDWQVYNNTFYNPGYSTYSAGWVDSLIGYNNIFIGSDAGYKFATTRDAATLAQVDHNNYGTSTFSIKLHVTGSEDDYASLANWQSSGELEANYDAGCGSDQNPGCGSIASDPDFTNGSGTYSLVTDFEPQAAATLTGGRSGGQIGADVSLVGVDAGTEQGADANPVVTGASGSVSFQ